MNFLHIVPGVLLTDISIFVGRSQWLLFLLSRTALRGLIITKFCCVSHGEFSQSCMVYLIVNCSHFFLCASQRISETSQYYTVEPRASTRILHLTQLLASVLISSRVFLTPLASSSIVLCRVFLGLPLPCLPWWFHSRACLAVLLDGFHSVWPSPLHLRYLICKSILGCFMHFHNSLFVIWSGQKFLTIFLRRLLIKTCSLAVILF
jgi:hypothetical protein